MPEPPASASAWELADRAYQAHHFQCPQCISAGVTRSQPRCAIGAALWEEYQQAGDPPHFTWLQKRALQIKTKPRNQNHDPHTHARRN